MTSTNTRQPQQRGVEPAMFAPPVPDDELLTPIQVADIVSLSVQTLARWRSGGQDGPRYVKLPNKAIRYRRADVNAWIYRQGQAA